MLHYTAMASAEAARDWLCNPEAEVSAHYVIGPDGTTWQLVDEAQRAWHAGKGGWGAVTDVNSRSIGIEIANTGGTPFAAPQMDAVEVLLAGILQRWAIRPERVIAHSCLAPGRKIDPGPRFDWRRLARQGLAIQLEAGTAEPDEARADALLQTAGYTAETDTATRLAAFRLRHNAQATGTLTPRDMALIEALAARYPVDAAPLTS
ncbi:N-acetylmuramoyl-L-alanine amidase [Pseudaestuariivita sp.]|uniref:N-acetylmuramoyl-L-alanine amidase n=1 Tax=Pseudaestuariivita sp. TaxID=2211669 RepID=UPI0040590CF5